jgi:hypothetical protein
MDFKVGLVIQKLKLSDSCVSIMQFNAHGQIVAVTLFYLSFGCQGYTSKRRFTIFYEFQSDKAYAWLLIFIIYLCTLLII